MLTNGNAYPTKKKKNLKYFLRHCTQKWLTKINKLQQEAHALALSRFQHSGKRNNHCLLV